MRASDLESVYRDLQDALREEEASAPFYTRIAEKADSLALGIGGTLRQFADQSKNRRAAIRGMIADIGPQLRGEAKGSNPLAPMPPTKGPPLPKALNISWPGVQFTAHDKNKAELKKDMRVRFAYPIKGAATGTITRVNQDETIQVITTAGQNVKLLASSTTKE